MNEINLPLLKFGMFEIQMLTTDSGPQFNFPINNYLTGKKVYAIEAYNSNDIDRSPISTGFLAWTPAHMLASSVTLHCFAPEQPNNPGQKGDWIKQRPSNAFHRLWNTNGATNGVSTYAMTILGGLVIDFNNSYITFTQNPTFTENRAALFGVYYK